MPRIEPARTFGAGISSVKRHVATTYREGRFLAPKKRPDSKPRLDEAQGGCWKRTSRSSVRPPRSTDLILIEEAFSKVKARCVGRKHALTRH